MCSVHLPTDAHLAPVYAFMFPADSLWAELHVQWLRQYSDISELSLVCRETQCFCQIDLHTWQKILHYGPIC